MALHDVLPINTALQCWLWKIHKEPEISVA